MTIRNSTSRSIAAILMLTCIIWGYWWIMLSLAIIFLFIFDSYYEIIAWGIIYDALYGITYMFTITAIILFVISIFLKKYLFAYDK